ncbi:MAG: helix-hairpin-helix domain-containing protein [Deltaproteobacteria bacterium]|nr:helix-hairpin-helix domain-containing protein [Deltaproteobacteria bacterium]
MKKALIALVLLAQIFAANFTMAASQEIVTGVVNINTASAEQLTAVPGIGAAKAQAIVELRSQKPFSHVEDLLLVKGIGEKSLQKMKAYFVLNGDTTIAKKKIKKDS